MPSSSKYRGFLSFPVRHLNLFQKFVVDFVAPLPGFYRIHQSAKGAQIPGLSLECNLGYPQFPFFIKIYPVISAGIGLDQTPSFDCLQKRDGRPLRQLQVLFIDTGLKTAAAFRLSALQQRTGSANASTMKRGTYYETW